MKQIYFSYDKWEDYNAGMYYDDLDNITIDEAINLSYNLLVDLDELKIYMLKVTRVWINSTLHNLTNSSMNHQAWLGQSACMLKNNVPERYTRMAWRELTEEQKYKANKVADRVKFEWVISYDINYRLDKWLK